MIEILLSVVRAEMNREFLLLAKDYDPSVHNIGGYYVSIKLDGQRAFWDGGVTRGLDKRQVPWANPKDKNKLSQMCTGLWSRYGNIIHAPNWFVDKLPKGIFLDGELYIGRQKFQETRSITSTLEPGAGWYDIRFHVFDMPIPSTFFTSGKINNQNFSHFIDEETCFAFLNERLKNHMMTKMHRFDITVQRMLRMAASQNEVWKFAPQVQLPSTVRSAQSKMYEMLDDETNKGGEGLILRAPSSLWVPKRVNQLLKVKKFLEDEATVIGYTAGIGKFRGMLGALHVIWNTKQFYLSGFNDEERQLTSRGREWAMDNPGKDYDGSASISVCFERGSVVRFRYREVTNDGVPKEGRFFR